MAPHWSGTGAPNPGGDRRVTSSRPRAATSGLHTAAVSGFPWTSTTPMAASPYSQPGLRFLWPCRRRQAAIPRCSIVVARCSDRSQRPQRRVSGLRGRRCSSITSRPAPGSTSERSGRGHGRPVGGKAGQPATHVRQRGTVAEFVGSHRRALVRPCLRCPTSYGTVWPDHTSINPAGGPRV